MKIIYVFLFVSSVLSVNGQNPFYGWPNTGIELVENGDLPVIGKINNETIFYFNLNEDGWDSVYTFSYGLNKVKIFSDGGYERYFFSRSNGKHDFVDYFTSTHIKYKNKEVNSRDSIHRTYYPSGTLKTRNIISTQGIGTYYSTESHDRFWDEFRYSDGKLRLEFVKDSVINGHEVVVSGKIKNGDTASFSIVDNNGHIWKYVEEKQRVDFRINSNEDTLFTNSRPHSRTHEWWYTDSNVDTTWYNHGAMVINKNNRNGSKEKHEIDREGKSVVTYFTPGIWGEEKQRINFRVHPPQCLDYSYFENDTTFWNYVIRQDTNYKVEKWSKTISGKNKEILVWENGEMRNTKLDTNRNYTNSHCGTTYSTAPIKIRKGFEVVIDSVVVDNKKLDSADLSELLIRSNSGWENWNVTVDMLTKKLTPEFTKGQQTISVEWVRNGSQICAYSEKELGWMFLSGSFGVGGLKYKTVEWNGKSIGTHEKIGVYFHLNNLDVE